MENMHSSLDRCLFLLPISIHVLGMIKTIYKITIIPTSWASQSLRKNLSYCNRI